MKRLTAFLSAIPTAIWVLFTAFLGFLVAYWKGRRAGRGAVLEDQAEKGRQLERKAVDQAAKRQDGAALQDALDRKLKQRGRP